MSFWWLVVALLLGQSAFIVYLLQGSAGMIDTTPFAAQAHLSQQHNNNNNSREANKENYTLAAYESYGFFQDIPESKWRLKQRIAISTPHHLDATNDKISDFYHRPRGYYQNNWEPDFSCSFSQFLGPIRDGHKWTCDPHRLQQQDECLVYSFGSNGNFDFEAAVLEVVPQCQVHIFDPGSYQGKMKRALKNANAHYHTFGMKASYVTDPSEVNHDRLPPRGVFKTFPEIIQELGHMGRTVSLFKMDIEGGEWTTFRDWLLVDNSVIFLQQILVEVHDAPPIANTFFTELHKAGYAMFHKEPNIQFAGGDAVEFGFIKLRPSFFNGDTSPVNHSSQAFVHAENNKEEYKINREKAEYDYQREMKATGVV